jgi:peroxiredoxin family protein/TusA-related sulfurtransferase
VAQRILAGHGYTNVRNLQGGYKLYADATAPVPSPNSSEKPLSDGDAPQSAASADDAPQSAASAGDAPHSVASGASRHEPLRVNACGMQCPGPILQLKKAMDKLAPGERVEIVATDAGFSRDAAAWCHSTGNRLLSNQSVNGQYTLVIEKGNPTRNAAGNAAPAAGAPSRRDKTLILFSDDLDKALATFVLANGAAATGEKVTVFCTFWGLNVLKKVRKPRVKKDLFAAMFGMMLPSNSLKLKLSKLNMWGMGRRMMRYIMKRKGILSLEELRAQAIAQGVEFIACQMSMDVMGVSREELIDEVTVGGVATYMERADRAGVNLFI